MMHDIKKFFAEKGVAIFYKGRLVLGVHPDNVESNLKALADGRLQIDWKSVLEGKEETVPTVTEGNNMEDKIKRRLEYLDRRIEELGYRESNYDEDEQKLTKYGLIQLGWVRGSIISKEMEIDFLESLLKQED